MVKTVALMAAVGWIAVSPSSLRAGQSNPFGPRCLHGAGAQMNHRLRREEALKVAQAINRAEGSGGPRRPSQSPPYRPLEELPNVPPAPSGFRLQFYTDGPTYTFSLKDTLDPCRYAIFSDQDQGIYEAITAPKGVQVVPADTP